MLRGIQSFLYTWVCQEFWIICIISRDSLGMGFCIVRTEWAEEVRIE